MVQIQDEVGGEVQCACGCTVWRELVQKGDNAGQWRLVNVDGRMHFCNGVPHKMGNWTDEERAFIAANYGPMTAGQIALALNRAVMTVRNVIREINKQRRGRK
jgi:hypothetical protein